MASISVAALILAGAVLDLIWEPAPSEPVPSPVNPVAGTPTGGAGTPAGGSTPVGHWVSTHGSDGNAGTSRQPWRTIAHAVQNAPIGSAIFLRGGTYAPFTVGRSGLTISSAPGERAVIQGVAGVRDVILITAQDVTVTDLTVAGCVPKVDADVNVHGDHGSGIRLDRTRGVTVRGVTVRDSHGTTAAGLPVGCYGILATFSRDSTIAGAELYGNGAGVVVIGGGRGILVEDNNIHDQDVILHNTADRNLDDYGGYGLAATFVTDRPGPTFRRNTLVGNAGPSSDYGVDGGGVEIYDAANVTIDANTFADNDGVMETGTGSAGACADIVFSGNTVTGRSLSTRLTASTGLVLRCAANMAVRGNEFSELDAFTLLVATDGPFAGSVENVRVSGNTVTQGWGAVYLLQFGSGDTPRLSIDRNRYQGVRPGFAVIDDGEQTTVTFAAWKLRTGYDVRSTASAAD